jgi:hypothetical protein
VLDLGAAGLVAVAAVSTINLGLRSPVEQDALVAGFARYLNSLTGPVQFLVRTVALDLSGHLHALREQARTIPHPALAAAAAAHHAHLASLTTPTVHAYGYGEVEDGAHSGAAGGPELLTRQVLLVLREPGRQGGAQRLLRRLDDAAAFLAPLDIRLTALSTGHITALLAGHGNPDPSTRRQPPPDRPTANPHGGDARTSDDPAPRTSIEPRSARSARPPQPHQRQPHRSPVPAHRTINNGTGDYDDVQLEDMALADDRRPNPGQTSASEGELPQLPTERNRYLARHATSRQDAAGVEGGAVDFLLADDLTDDLVDNLIDDGGIESDLGSRSDLDRGSDLGGGAAGWWGR